MKKIFKKKHGLRQALFILAALFVFQSFPPLCGACFIGECGSAVEVKTASNEMDCHGSASEKPCHSKNTDTDSQSSDSQKDSCPSCSCSISGATDISEKTVLTSAGLSPLFFVYEVSEIMNHDLICRDFSFRNLPEPLARTHPIFIINSSFLI